VVGVPAWSTESVRMGRPSASKRTLSRVSEP
jgi:hypothetical protein